METNISITSQNICVRYYSPIPFSDFFLLRNFLAHTIDSLLQKKRALQINVNPEKGRETWQLFKERDTESSINISTVLQSYNTTKSRSN